MKYIAHLEEQLNYASTSIIPMGISDYFYDRFRSKYLITNISVWNAFTLDNDLGQLTLPSERIILELNGFEQPSSRIYVHPGSVYIPFTPGSTKPTITPRICEEIFAISDGDEPPSAQYSKYNLPRSDEEGGILTSLFRVTFRLESFDNLP